MSTDGITESRREARADGGVGGEASSEKARAMMEARVALDAGAPITRGQLAALLQVDVRTIDRWREGESIPGPDGPQLGARCVRWRPQTVRRLLGEVEARRGRRGAA